MGSVDIPTLIVVVKVLAAVVQGVITVLGILG